MRLETAHKILIGAAIAFFMLLAAFGIRQWARSGEVGSLLLAGGSVAVAGALGLYLRSFTRADRG